MYAVIIATFVVALIIYLRPPTRFTPRVIDIARQLVTDDDDDVDSDTPYTGARSSRHRYARRVAMEVKANMFGTPKNTQAHRQLAGRHALRIMREHGVRPAHIGQLMPWVLAFALTPTEEEIDVLKAQTHDWVKAARGWGGSSPEGSV
nr:MAG: hypothetical protein [Hangzhou tombus-like virus 1]